MSGQSGQDVLVPAPVLQHLGGQFYKVPFHRSAAEPGHRGFTADVVHDVAELMEEGLHLPELHQTVFALLGGPGEVAHHGRHRQNGLTF